MKMEQWYYRKQEGDAGLNKKPARLKDLGEHSVRVFVREVIQNNLDAAQEGLTVRVKIKIQEWHPKEIEAFFEFLGKDHIDLLKKSSADPDPSVAPHLKSSMDIINHKTTKAFLVIVEETNCIGLLGPVRESKNEKSHFDALMRKVENNEAKKETTNTGGTWGKGSSIFTYTSLLWTWFSYSKLSKPWTDHESGVEHRKRFIGRCMIAPFFDESKNESILGDGWFCDKEKLASQKIDAYPYVNSKADEFAQKLGLNIRDKDVGTTFYVPFFNSDIDNKAYNIELKDLQTEFCDEVLQNWFISIYNEVIIVEVETEKELIVIDKQFLQTVRELKFKLQLLEWYDKDCPPDDKRFIREQIELEVPGLKADYLTGNNLFAKNKQKAKSDLIIRVLDDDEDFDDTWNTVNTVAFCRNKGMIINDEQFLENRNIRTEGIFFGGLIAKSELNKNKRQHLDLFLAYAENPAHNVWCRTAKDYDRCFLDRFDGQRPKPEASINYLYNEISKVFKKLLEKDTIQKENKDICSIFRKLARLKAGGDDVGGKALFYMRTIKDEIDAQGRYVYTRRIIAAANENTIEIYFKTYIYSLEGERDKDFEHLGISEFGDLEIVTTDDNILSQGINPKITLAPGEEKIVSIKTCKIDSNPSFKNLDPFIKTYAKQIEK